jgi:hypothetical protein
VNETRRKLAVDEVYDFLPEDENEPQEDLAPAETAALHTIRDVPRLGVRDPARRESAIGAEGDEDELPASWFDDEEPEGPPPVDGEELETADVEDVLVAQHYAFETDGAGAGTE